MLNLSLWVAFTDVSSLSLQCPKIVYLPQAIKSLLFTNQKRTNKFHCSTITRGPKNCRKRTKRGTNFWQMGIQRGPFLTYVKGDLKFEFFRFVHKQVTGRACYWLSGAGVSSSAIQCFGLLRVLRLRGLTQQHNCAIAH